MDDGRDLVAVGVRAASVVVVGVVLAGAAARVGTIGAADAAALAGISFGVGVAALVGGRCLLMLPFVRRPLSLRIRTALVACIPVVAMLAGSVVAARAMFVSDHDLRALAVVVVGAGTAGVLAALGLADRVEASRRRAEEAGRRQLALEASRRELVAWISHDLRTPLAGMRAMSEALADGVVTDSDTVARYHRNLQSETERLGRLLDDLFELSRLQVDRVELTLEAVSLGDLVSDAVSSASAIADAKHVEVVGRLDGQPPVLDLSSPEMLRVVHNLLDNAIRHTPAGGRVEVEVFSDGHDGVVSVVDGCGGIEETEMSRVFDLAYRGDTARSPAEVGGGFGLAIARGLVEAHGGRIDLCNAEAGCRFTVRLPLPPAGSNPGQGRADGDTHRTESTLAH